MEEILKDVLGDIEPVQKKPKRAVVEDKENPTKPEEKTEEEEEEAIFIDYSSEKMSGDRESEVEPESSAEAFEDSIASSSTSSTPGRTSSSWHHLKSLIHANHIVNFLNIDY